ncbi:hypothetical protein NA56DRAFT_650232 [Hyaloscypha hepaticicola]|uniref:Uncharacterized protein n=1 Tax=Hyaloscypha hepaticicola TaxID=2082293 RepID=A0A2J6PMP3_9HELO|nr:hypothetical protein NA56DRAFT_650232 [Hyaloscypha hepaticicola]
MPFAFLSSRIQNSNHQATKQDLHLPRPRSSSHEHMKYMPCDRGSPLPPFSAITPFHYAAAMITL